MIAAYEADSWFRDDAHSEKLTVDEGLWYNVDGRVVVPSAPDLRRTIISALHDSPFAGHIGINKTTLLVSRYY